MSWEFHDAREAFGRYAQQWDEINRAQGNHILLDSLFVEPLVRYFAPPGCLLGISNDTKYPGMALVTKEKAGFWQTFQPAQGPLGLIVLANAANVEEQIQTLIRYLPGYAFGFSVSQQDPDHSVFRNLSQRFGVEYLEYIQTGRVSVAGPFDDYWGKRGKDLLTNLARRQRRLLSQGIQMEFLIERDPSYIADCIMDYGKLEESGWKADEGTAVTINNSQGLFYRDVLEKFCHQGGGVIYRLLFDGELVASQLGLERNGMLILLKMAYEEKLGNFAPGFLIQQKILESVFSEKKIKAVEFYGRVREGWTTKWTDEFRSMYHVNFYRHEWVPAMRRSLKRTLQFFSKAIEHEHRDSPS